MSNKAKIIDPLMDSILLKVSQQIPSKQTGFCFSAGYDTTASENTLYTPHDSSEFDEFVNSDILGEEEENLKPFNRPINGTKYEDITKDGGVLKTVLDPGVGQEVVPEDSIVLVHYFGYVSNPLKRFYTTYRFGPRPISFRLGTGLLYPPGLEVAILTMRQGENAIITLSPKYGYGEKGCPPDIPPNTTVSFDVCLFSYFPSSFSGVFFGINKNNSYRFQTNLEIVQELYYEGKKSFRINRIDKAVHDYEKAKEILHLTLCNNALEETEKFNYLNKLYSNLSICYLNLCDFYKVCRMGSEAMMYSERFSRNNVKLWFNWGKALRFLKDFTQGKRKLQRALQLEPENESIHYELQRLETDRALHYRITSLPDTLNNDPVDDNKPSEFWQVFDITINEFVDSTD